jgi:hypothetical protein
VQAISSAEAAVVEDRVESLVALLVQLARLVVRLVVLRLAPLLDRIPAVSLAAAVVDACRLGDQEFVGCHSLLAPAAHPAHRTHLETQAG